MLSSTISDPTYLRAAGHRPCAGDAGRQDRAEPADERDAGGDGAGALQVVVRGLRPGARQDGWPLAPGRVPPRPPRRTLHDLFPDRLVDSELGAIPEGWEVKALGEVAEQRRSGVKPEEIDAESPYIALEHMPKRCIALTQWGNADGLASGKFKFEQGDLLFGKLRPYFHKVGVAPLDGVCSTDIVVVQPKSNLWSGFVLGHTSSAEFVDYTDATSTGTRMPRTNWADMARYKVALPSIEVPKAFTGLVEPCVNRIVSAIHESHSIAAQRDALLPGLVSGKVRAALSASQVN